MSTGLCAEDFEVFLDPHDTCPAVFQERIFKVKEDEWTLDFVTSEEDLCWMASNQTLFVWDMKATNGSGLKLLPLPHTGFPPTSRLSCVFRDSGNKVPSALFLHPEGHARWWPSVSLNTSIDTKLADLNEEVPVFVHLLKTSRDGHGPVFITLTSSGTFLILACGPNGKMAVTRLVKPETRRQSISRRLTSVIFSRTTEARTDFIRSLLIYEKSEPKLAVGISPKTLKAVDLDTKRELWILEALEGLDTLFKTYLEDTEEDVEELEGVMTSFLDAQYYKGGLLVLFTGLHGYSDVMKFYLVHISGIETTHPVFGAVTEVTLPDRMAAMFEVSDPSSYQQQVRLCIPRETANAPLIARTDGIMIIHGHYVHTVYIPDDLSEGVTLSQEFYLPPDRRAIGYGLNEEFVFIMLTTGAIEKIRLIPRTFPRVHLNAIVDMVEEMHRPERGVGQDIYIALRHFFDKLFGDCAARAAKMLRENEADDVLKGVRMAMGSVIGDLDIHSDDFLAELRDKKRFYDAFVLFLKYGKILAKIVDAEWQENRNRLPLQGAEAITELNERIAVMEHIFKWAVHRRQGGGTSDEEDVLHQVVRLIVTGPRQQVRPDDWKRMEYLTHIPEAALRCMENMRNTVAEFDSFDQRFQGFRLFCDLFVQFSNGVTYARRTTVPIQKQLGELRWTTELAHVYPRVSNFLLDEWNLAGYSEQMKAMLVDYAVNLMKFFFREIPTQPNGDAVLDRLWKMGCLDQALELALQYKDFKIMCDMIQGLNPRQRQNQVEKYKRDYAEDNFEEYYLDYLAEQRNYNELLQQQGELAKNKINEIENVRWRRDIGNGDFADAGRTLQAEVDREKTSIDRKQGLQSLAKLAYACVDPREEDTREELDEADLQLFKLNYQRAIPRQLLESIYHGDWDKPLTMDELLQMGFHVIDSADCTLDLFAMTIVYGARLVQWDEESAPDYLRLIQAAWKKVLAKTTWTQVFQHNFKETLFARVLRTIVLTESKVAIYCIPTAVDQIAPDLENSQKGNLIATALEKAVQDIGRFLQTGIPPV